MVTLCKGLSLFSAFQTFFLIFHEKIEEEPSSSIVVTVSLQEEYRFQILTASEVFLFKVACSLHAYLVSLWVLQHPATGNKMTFGLIFYFKIPIGMNVFLSFSCPVTNGNNYV